MALPSRLRAALAIVLIAMCGNVRAAGYPVVIAVDATLGADDRAAVDASIRAIATALARDRELGLVVFGRVVLRVAPLGPLDAAQLDEIDATLNAPDDAADASLATGLERAIDELGEREGGQVVMFARARLGSPDTPEGARFGEWYRELLLPVAAERGIAITLVSPDVDADAAVRADLLSLSGNASLSLEASADMERSVLARLVRQPVARSDLDADADAASIADVDGLAPSVARGSDTTATVPEVASEGTPTASSVATNATSSTEPPVAVSDRTLPANTAATGTGLSSGGDRKTLYAVAAFALSLAALALLVLRARSSRHRRSASDTPTRRGTPTTGSSSALPTSRATRSRARASAPNAGASSAKTVKARPSEPARRAAASAPTARSATRSRFQAPRGTDRTRRRRPVPVVPSETSAPTRLNAAAEGECTDEQKRSAAPIPDGADVTRPNPEPSHEPGRPVAPSSDDASVTRPSADRPEEQGHHAAPGPDDADIARPNADRPDELELLERLTAMRGKGDWID